MGSIVIAMPRIEDSNHLNEMLLAQGLSYDIDVVSTASEALRIAHDRDYGIIICTKSLKDMSAAEVSEYLPEMFGMVILTKDMSLDLYSEKVMKVMMPFKTRELVSTVNMMMNFFVRKIKKKNVPLKRSAKEEKMIADAKALLMNRNGLSEPEAFRYIQKNSMDTGRSMAESAQMILLLNP